MIIPKYTLDDFKKLPLRAIVAFATRCARRVEHLAIPPDDHPEHEGCLGAVGDAIQLAEDFARGSPCTSCESVIAAISACRDASSGDLVRKIGDLDYHGATSSGACASELITMGMCR